MKLKIGDFARIGRVTVQALRHYDNLNLLKPAKVDSLSGYRYYDLDQLPRLHRILALKDLGFSLDQVAQMIQDDLPPSELRGMFKLKKNELQQNVQEQLNRLERLEARLKMIEQEDSPLTYDVIIKKVDSIPVASVREIIPSYWDISPLWEKLARQVKKHKLSPIEPYLAVYHSNEPEIDMEACAPLEQLPAKLPGLQIRELPTVESMASTIHHGSFNGLATAYAELVKWIELNGYLVDGPDREIYLRLPDFGKSGDESAITEIQVPVRKAN
ncbi:MAG: MerR family transcriptional regulator [Chloroflexi bacterium]|nr:MerR family transcriptional regulator [Chloroflexota bacterium]